ncbi:MAG: shikimate kinase, partial [Candidatus Omnitrophica bacterium]|nr:shikimate kinase [Candidatus Omnitrophota bacterium]
IMKKSGILICLCANGEEILKRVSSNSLRPILNVAHPRERIELLLKMRTPYYMQADKAIDTSDLSIKQVVAKISKILMAKK